MAKAKTAVDVVLGEAGGRTEKERFADMKAIASVIANRAKALGVSVKDVISVRSEFNAYGKSLPKGVEKFRSLAERAIREVEENGPIHNATFYATPGARRNLPGGLQEETTTAGHVYFSDPQNRSIRTAKGFAQPTSGVLSYAPTGEEASTPFDAITAEPTTFSSPMGLLGDRITSDFGNRARPRTSLGLGSAFHGGIDMSIGGGVSGYPVEAAAGGTVTFAGPQRGYGNMVEITHPDGMRTRYGHLGSVGNVAIGDEIARGTPVGLVGNTGNSSGPHLHFETFDAQGARVDPRSVVSFDRRTRVPTPVERPTEWASAVPGAVERRSLPDISPVGNSRLLSTQTAEAGMTPSASASGLLSYREPESMASLQSRANAARQRLEAENGSLNLSTAQMANAMKNRERALGILSASNDPVAAIEKVSPLSTASTTPSLANAYGQMASTMGQAGVLGLSGQKVLDPTDLLGGGKLAPSPGLLAAETMPTVDTTYTEVPTTVSTVNQPQTMGRVSQPVGLLSSDEYGMVRDQQQRLSEMGTNRAIQTKQALKKGLSAFGGGVLGGLIAGPIGSVVGGLLGPAIVNGGILTGRGTNYFPATPSGPVKGDGKQTDYGRSVQKSSGQYDRAVKSGSAGLY